MKISSFFQFVGMLTGLYVIICSNPVPAATMYVPHQISEAQRAVVKPLPPSQGLNQAPLNRSPAIDKGWRTRVVTEKELSDLTLKDPELSPSIARHILARLNARAYYYIEEDIREGRPLKVPNNFSAFKQWTPMPKTIPDLLDFNQSIVILKDLPFIGWYEKGKLVGDSHICIGKEGQSTRAGVYRVLEKDENHVSRSYPNAYGEPAPMPNALRIYELVWIHTGDIAKANCSHGCINLPMMPSVKLFNWAKLNTPVLVVESLNDLDRVLQHSKSRCAPTQTICLAYPVAGQGKP